MSVFSEIPKEEILHRSKSFILIYDRYPVSNGHILIISKSVKTDYFDLSDDERFELSSLILTAKNIIEENGHPDGYNIGMNCGKAAGQTVMHFHCHVIPRYTGDVEDPTGGIRHCIMGKGYY